MWRTYVRRVVHLITCYFCKNNLVKLEIKNYLTYICICQLQLAIHLMVNQLLGISSELDINEMARCFSDFVDGCLSLPINLPGCAYHTAMKVRKSITNRLSQLYHKVCMCFRN